MPKVTVVIPVYNVAKYFRKCAVYLQYEAYVSDDSCQ